MYQDPIQQSIADLFPRLRSQLEEEYGGSVPSETIDRVAKQTLSEFQSARVREFVAVFAWRRARELLQGSA
jgi:hypothetical protein